MKKTGVYLPGLNGFRAIAAIGVVIAHIILALGDFGLNDKIFGVDKFGKAVGPRFAGLGVTVFFTLSGFLITYLLLKEKELRPLNIKQFYIRRILRIWPLYYLYLFVTLATLSFFAIDYDRSSVSFYVFLAANVPFIFSKTIPLLIHYWSLGVEEQFYLFFPHIAKLSDKKLFKVVIVLMAFLIVAKVIGWIALNKLGIAEPLTIVSVCRFHTMLLGVTGAILYFNNSKWFMKLTTNLGTQVVCWSSFLLVLLNKFHIASAIDGEMVSIITVCLIIGQVTGKNKIISLENRIFDFLGKISYGIYIIHPLVIFYASKVIGKYPSPSLMKYITVFGFVLSITILLAYISFEYYEKWFLKLKDKYSVINGISNKVAAEDRTLRPV
jgi:peptidoglycan/LPS O-acetylase OafA/YrhL